MSLTQEKLLSSMKEIKRKLYVIVTSYNNIFKLTKKDQQFLVKYDVNYLLGT